MKNFTIDSRCPFCRKANDRQMNTQSKRRPEDGDWSLCFSCGEWAVYQLDGHDNVRKPTWPEYQLIAASPELRKAREVWVYVKQQQRGNKT